MTFCFGFGVIVIESGFIIKMKGGIVMYVEGTEIEEQRICDGVMDGEVGGSDRVVVVDREVKKRQDFERLAERRVSNVVKGFEAIGHLYNKNAYSFDDEDVKDIFEELDEAFHDLKVKFKVIEGKTKKQFSLKKA